MKQYIQLSLGRLLMQQNRGISALTMYTGMGGLLVGSHRRKNGRLRKVTTAGHIMKTALIPMATLLMAKTMKNLQHTMQRNDIYRGDLYKYATIHFTTGSRNENQETTPYKYNLSEFILHTPIKHFSQVLLCITLERFVP